MLKITSSCTSKTLVRFLLSKSCFQKNYSSSTTTGDIPIVNVPVLHRISQFHDRVALADQHGEHTFSQLFLKSEKLSRLISSQLGVTTTNERIAFLCPNDASYIISQWATWLAGHIAVPLSPMHPTSQLEYFINNSDAAIVLTTKEFSETVDPVLSGRQMLVLDDTMLTDNPNITSSDLLMTQSKEFYETSDAMILYTSGTTGRPKGVVLTHNNLLSQVSCLHKAWGWTPRDVILHCLPLHHTHGIVNALLGAFYAGARVEMQLKFDAANIWSKMLALDTPVESRVNLFMAVPTIYAKLIQEYKKKFSDNHRMKEFIKSICAQNVRLMVSGSAALPEPILTEWQNLTEHVLLERYGMTEIGMALSNPLKGTRKPGFVGNPLPGVEVCVAKFKPGNSSKFDVICTGNERGTQVTIGMEAEVGELLVKGPNVFKEYWNNPEATAKEFTPCGWFRTGDTAQYKDGSYKILGRSSVDIIKSGGFKISALDVERIYLSHPDVADIAVVGISDITWGQKVAAVIVWRGQEKLDTVALRKWGKERMPHYQIPLVYITVDKELPRNNMGKVNKKQLIKDFFPDQD